MLIIINEWIVLLGENWIVFVEGGNYIENLF